MIIYNVTLNVDPSVHDEWLDWIKIHIPKVLSTGLFREAKLTKVLVDEDLGGETYSVQFRANSRHALEEYYQKHAERLRQESLNLFADKVLAFRTELEVIDEYSVSLN